MSFVIVVCVLALLVSPYFPPYYEAEHQLGWPQAVHLWFAPCPPVVMILMSLLITFILPWIVGLFGDLGDLPPMNHRRDVKSTPE